MSQAAAIGGGNLSAIARIRLVDGREAIVKAGPAPATEAAMLEVIAASGAPAPRVLGWDDGVLVLERLPADGQLGNAWASLGEALARLHGRGRSGARYGWPRDYAFGRVAIANGWSDHWPGFWAERRLLIHAGHVTPDLMRRIEALAARLDDRLPARPDPALLHGDLWGGNVLCRSQRVTGLVDPACYYGHAEVDFAMPRLFDRPHARLYEAYGGLDAGERERLPIYQLWPALVHLRLFGEGYRGLVERLLAAAGA